jgi:hypothetical protein
MLEASAMAYEYVPYEGEVVTRSEARWEGLDRYFTGKPCKHGHLSQRKTKDGVCTTCEATRVPSHSVRLKAQAKYREANRDKLRADGREYSRTHREQSNAWAAVPENRAKKNAQARERQRELMATDPEKLRAKGRADYAKNPAAGKANRKRWNDANKERMKEYRLANKEKFDAARKEWEKRNPDRRAATTKKWQLANQEYLKAKRRENPEQTRAIKLRYRARLESAEGNHTGAELKTLFGKQKGKCAYCSAKLDQSYHADHIVALSKGGTNWISNIALSCGPCNVRKHAMDPIEFARRNGRLI